MNLPIPIPIADSYIGQAEVIAAIQQALQAVAAGPDHCGVLNLVAEGGGGKTFLLRQLPTLLGPTVAYIVRIIDLSDTQNRSGTFLEEALIAGLQVNTGQSYRLAGDMVDAIFKTYRDERAKLDRERNTLPQDAFQQRRQQVRQRFAEALNQLARQRPVILRFDTTEALQSEPPAPVLLELIDQTSTQANREIRLLSALDLFFEWFREVIPQLRNVLVLLCGRPVKEPFNVEQTLYGRSQAELKGVPHQQIDIRPLIASEIKTYLQAVLPEAYLQTVLPNGIDREDNREKNKPALTILTQEIAALSDGIPLLVTSYIWLASIEQLRGFEVGNRTEFERYLVTRVLNPIENRPANFELEVLGFCFYLLAYARRGLSREQLKALLTQFELPKPHATFTPDEQTRFATLLEQINKVALIKERPNTGVIFLHDEVHRMLDQFQATDSLGLRDEILAALRALAQDEHETWLGQAATTPPERSALIAAISQRIYYELELDPRKGYEEYLLAQLRLFENREYELPLLLRDDLWRWINLRATDQTGQTYQPNRERLANPKNKLSLGELIADDLVWLVRSYIARNRNKEAVLVADQGQAWLTLYAHDAYFKYDLLQTRAHALTLYYNQDVRVHGAEQNFQDALLLAQLAAERPDPEQLFFHTYADYFLGRTYTLYGFMCRTLFDFEQARTQYAAAAMAYQRFREAQLYRATRYLNLDEADVQLKINLIYVLARSGAFSEAEQLLVELRRAIRAGTLTVSIGRQALIYNLSSILESERRNPKASLLFAQQAMLLAQQSNNQRIIAQVQAQYGNAGHDSIKQAPYRVEPSYEQAFEAALKFFKEAEEQTSQAETALDYARYLRTLAFNEQRQPFPRRTLVNNWFQKADDLLEQAEQASLNPVEDSTKQASTPSGSISQLEIMLERVVLLRFQTEGEQAETVLTQAEALIQTAKLPRRVLLLAASLKFQRAWLAADVGNSLVLVRNLVAALAYCRLYAETDRTLIRFRELIPQNMAQYDDQLIQAVQRLIDHAAQKLAPDLQDVLSGHWRNDVPDLAARWPMIWNEEVTAVQNMIEILFTERGLA